MSIPRVLFYIHTLDISQRTISDLNALASGTLLKTSCSLFSNIYTGSTSLLPTCDAFFEIREVWRAKKFRPRYIILRGATKALAAFCVILPPSFTFLPPSALRSGIARIFRRRASSPSLIGPTARD